MSQAEKTFQDRGEQIAKKLEAMAAYVRSAMAEDWGAIERASEVVAEVHAGVGAHSLRTLIKRGALVDEERDSEPQPFLCKACGWTGDTPHPWCPSCSEEPITRMSRE